MKEALLMLRSVLIDAICFDKVDLIVMISSANLTVFLTLERVISRVSVIVSGAMTAARLVLTSGSISLPPGEGNSATVVHKTNS